MQTLVTGGARSGKSSFAEKLYHNYNDVLYVSSYVVDKNDLEMQDRIKKHQSSRNQNWGLYESNIYLDSVKADKVFFDCLAIFTSNVLYHYTKDTEEINHDMIRNHIKEQVDALLKNNKDVIIVTNEVGMGLVPLNSIERAYRDILGQINQYVASKVDQVYLVTCGIPLKIKEESNEN